MSATGQGGVSILTGTNHATLAPVTLNFGEALTFTHNLGRRAFEVLITEGTSGALLPNTRVAVTQPTDDVVVLTNADEGRVVFYAAVRWENLTEETNIIRDGTPSVTFVPPRT